MCRSELFWTIVDQFGDPKPIAAQPSCPSVNVLQLLEEILRDAFYTNLDQSWNYTLRAKKAMELCSEKMDHHHWRMSASHYKWFLVKNCCKSREILKMNLCFVNFALDLTFKMVHWYCWSEQWQWICLLWSSTKITLPPRSRSVYSHRKWTWNCAATAKFIKGKLL